MTLTSPSNQASSSFLINLIEDSLTFVFNSNIVGGEKEHLLLKVFHIELVHSMPSNSGGRKSASGRRLAIIAALPRIRWRDIFWISWPIISLSSEPVCLASAEPRRFSWLMARWCMPPSVSRAMGRKTSPCCRQASAVSRIFRS